MRHTARAAVKGDGQGGVDVGQRHHAQHAAEVGVQLLPPARLPGRSQRFYVGFKVLPCNHTCLPPPARPPATMCIFFTN